MFALATSVLSALILGAGHLASWELKFKNSSGRKLWRISALIVTLVPPMLLTLEFLRVNTRKAAPTASVFLYVNVGAYFVARFILAFLLVYSFYSLPAGVYETKNAAWLQFIPFLH